MAERQTKRATRREQVRVQRARATADWRSRLLLRVVSWPALASALFIGGATAVALLGEATVGYSVGQRIDRPVFARVGFQVPDAEQTAAHRTAARAATPSYYTPNPPSLTFDRIRADLMRLYQAAVSGETFAAYATTLKELQWPAEERAYPRLRAMADDAGRVEFQARVAQLPLETEYVVRGLLQEPRTPNSTSDYIRLEIPNEDGSVRSIDAPHADLVPQGNARALRGSAASIARKMRMPSLATTVEAIVLAVFREQPTVVYNQERTSAEMEKAEDATPVAMKRYEKGKVFVNPGVLGSEEYALLRAHHAAYLDHLEQDVPQARLWQRAGLVTLVTLVSIALLVYVGMHHRRVFELASRTVAFMALILGTLLAARLLDLNWPAIPELVFAPCLVAGSVLAIVFPRRFALGAICITAVLVCTIVGGRLVFLLTLFTGVVVIAFQLDEIRSRTKLITAGATTAVAVVTASFAGGLWEGHSLDFNTRHALWAGACALLASFLVSGVLPFIERFFRIATSLTLLEWRDPTRPLLQLLAQRAPGTYNHSLVLGTLAEAACERIGANGLLTQVGALYHDVGKIHKADYFTENQEGHISRHDNLAPTMSLLIILGHVKDGVEMAKEYKLPRVLHQFIEEHHGTTVVRYFHHVASEKQPRIAIGKHDREVPEAEFRYAGPKPRSRETAVLMLCDGVEGAVRSIQDPTPSRIESLVHQIVTDRLNDGQFDDCDITLQQIHTVEESLVKSLCSIYHGRVAYPKTQKPEAEASARPKRISV